MKLQKLSTYYTFHRILPLWNLRKRYTKVNNENMNEVRILEFMRLFGIIRSMKIKRTSNTPTTQELHLVGCSFSLGWRWIVVKEAFSCTTSAISCRSKQSSITRFVAIWLPLMFSMTSWCQCFVASFTPKTGWVPIFSQRWFALSKINWFLTLGAIWHDAWCFLQKIFLKPNKMETATRTKVSFSLVCSNVNRIRQNKSHRWWWNYWNVQQWM